MHRQEWTLGLLLEASGSYWQACTLHAAVALELFSLIGDQTVSAETMARKVDGDQRGVATLLHALVAMGLLQRSGGDFENTAFSRQFLDKSSSQYLGHIISHHHHLVASWADLETAVVTGSPVRSPVSHSDGAARESFLMGMFNIAMANAPKLVPLIDLSRRKRLLDLGGGPGTYAIHFCKHNPNLRAEIFDLPGSRPFAEKTVQKFGLKNRVVFQEGDFLKDDIKGTFDVAWLSHILHGEGPADCEKILAKAVSVLQPGSLLLIHEFILEDTQDGPLFPALFSLNMLLGTPKGRAYTETRLKEMMIQAGCRTVERIAFAGPNDNGVLSGVVA